MKIPLLKKLLCLGVIVGCFAVVAMQREQEEPLEESIRIESIVDAWVNQLRGGRFKLHSADFADLDLALNYLRKKQSVTSYEQKLAEILNEEIRRRVRVNESKKIATDLRSLEEDLSRFASYPDTLPLDADFLQSILSSVVTYQIATSQPRAFEDFKALLQGMLLSMSDAGQIQKNLQRAAIEKFATIPTVNLDQLGVCPLYPRTMTIDDGQPQQIVLPVFYTMVIKDPVIEWQSEEIPLEKAKFLPCYLDISKELAVPGKTVELLQLKTIYQDEYTATVGACPTLALHNALLVYDFVSSGDVNFLKNLSNPNQARDFIDANGCVTWANIEEVENYFNKNFPGDVKNNIGFLPTLLLLNDQYSALTYQPAAVVAKVKELKQRISAGLSQDKFFYSLIVGNEEKALIAKGIGHYYTVSIIKNGNTIQFVVTDTLATRYYLYEEASEALISKQLNLYEIKKAPSYELRLLLYFIEMVLKGSSTRIDLFKDTPLRPTN